MGWSDRDRADFNSEMDEFAEEMEEFAEEMAEMSESIVIDVNTALAHSGIRVEEHRDGTETIWIEGYQRHGQREASLRIEELPDGEDLVFMYFNGFDKDYHFVIEDNSPIHREGDVTVHAYDVSAVDIRGDGRGHGEELDSGFDENGNPHLVIRTENPEDIRVVRLDRRRFSD